MKIRPLTTQDHVNWMPLWQAYLDFYKHPLPQALTEDVFARLCQGEALVGLVAEDENGALLGFMNLVFHPSTWSLTSYCYVEDLLVDPQARGKGIARALFDHAGELAKSRQCDRVYWLTATDNTTARKLYDSIGECIPFVVYNRT